MERNQRSAFVVGLWSLQVVLVLLHAIEPFGKLGDTTYLLGVWLGPALAWYGTALAPARRRLVPALIAAGLTASALGDLVWLAYSWTGDALGSHSDSGIAAAARTPASTPATVAE